MMKEALSRKSCSATLHSVHCIKELALDAAAGRVCQLEDNASGIPARSSGIPRKAPGTPRLRAPATKGGRIAEVCEILTPTRSLGGAG